MKLPKVSVLKCDSVFTEIAYITDQRIPSAPTVDDWLRLSFSLNADAQVHSMMLQYPFIFSGNMWSNVKPIMTDCVSTFRNYCLVAAMVSCWNKAAATPFGTRNCMQYLSKVHKLADVLEQQVTGQMPEKHPLAHRAIKGLVTAIANIRAIAIMSSDDALTEDQCYQRFGVRCEIWRLLVPFDRDPFWGRFTAQLIQQEKQSLADLYIKIAMRFSKWQGSDLSQTIEEAKLMLPFSSLSENKQNEIKDLARCHLGETVPLGIAANIQKNVPPDNTAPLFIPMKSASITDIVGSLYSLKKIGE